MEIPKSKASRHGGTAFRMPERGVRLPVSSRRRLTASNASPVAVALCVLALLLLPFAASLAEAQPLRIARIKDIPDQYIGGEILRVVYQRARIPMELVDVPAKRALIESSSGALDGEVHRIFDVSLQYPSLLPLVPAINFIEPTAFVRKAKTMTVDGWDSIKPYNVAIVFGVGSSERGTREFPNVTYCTTLEQAFKMLTADRVDIVVSDEFSGLEALKKLGLQDDVTPLHPPLEHIEIFHFLNKRHADIIPRVEKVISGMAASGELARLRAELIERYLAQHDKPGRGTAAKPNHQEAR